MEFPKRLFNKGLMSCIVLYFVDYVRGTEVDNDIVHGLLEK